MSIKTVLNTVGESFRSLISSSTLESFTTQRKDQFIAIIAVSSAIGLAGILIGTYMIRQAPDDKPSHDSNQANSVEEPIVLRDFTIEQLREFNGQDEKPIYIALRGDVFDATIAKDMYGEGSSYHCFAGRDASRAMAKLSFDEEELSNPRLDDLNAFERDTLDGWVEKYKYYKAYPIVGKLSYPPAVRDFKREELAPYKGYQEVLQGRVDAEIYVGIGGKVLDVSYGGKEMYGKGGPYHIFAGIDASRALAKMSFDAADTASHDLSDLTSEQLQTLEDWKNRLSKKYPVVGNIVD